MFHKLTIRSLLIGGGIVITLLSCVVVCWSVLCLYGVNRKLERISRVNVEKVGYSVNVYKKLCATAGSVATLSAVSDKTAFETAVGKIAETLQTCSNGVQQLVALEVNSEGKTLCDSLVVSLDAIRSELARVTTFSDGGTTGRFSLLSGTIGKAEAVLDSLVQWNSDRIRYRINELRSVAGQQLWITVVFGFVVMSGTVALIIIILVKITGNLRLGMSMARSLSEGDFSRQLEVKGNDEIGKLVNWLNTTGEKLKGMFSTVKTNIMTLTFSIQALSGSAETILENSDRMGRHSKEAVDSADVISNNMNVLSEKAGQTYTSVNDVSESVAVVSTSLNGIAENCREELLLVQEAGEQASATGQLMEMLDKSARTITHIVDLISDITKRTNLLALNATIEAASAGDAGKGFAVVANEVKDLARQTAKAANDISQQIKDIQSNAGASVEAVGRIGAAIMKVDTISQTIVKAVDEQTATLTSISQTMSSVSGNMKEMADNVREGSEGVSEITYNINHLSSAFSDLGAGVREMENSLSDMGSLISVCEADVKQFKI
ncbi:MAG: methyl-accepting chemotaxis protein [Chitinispirillaceae bacterium]|nr:methyl-accepting chemotaxis protein [Chitinispirillaceae bacterium]